MVMAARKLVAFALLAALIPLGSVAPAGAACGRAPSLEEAVASAPIVFVGTVRSATSGRTVATVDVASVWKGEDLPEQLEVRGGFEDDPDPATFNVGGTYIFFPVNRRPPFVADACSGTRLYSGAPLVIPPYLADEAGTTTARLPLSAEDEPSPESTVFGPVIGAIVGLLVMFGLAAVYFGALRRPANGARASAGNSAVSRRRARAEMLAKKQVRGASRVVKPPRRTRR